MNMTGEHACMSLARALGHNVGQAGMLTATNLSSPDVLISSIDNVTASVLDGGYPYSEESRDTYGSGVDAYNSHADAVLRVMKNIITPAVCVFGMVGNMLNLLVLTRRRIQKTMDCSMERSAHVGLIALAISDMSYCISALLTTCTNSIQSVFLEKGFLFYVQRYGQCFTNIFMHTGTWLTLIMAVGRYAAICRPLQARYLVGITATRIAIVLTFALWTLLELPMFWKYAVHEIQCSEDTFIYILDLGPFVNSKRVKQTFTYLWSVVGFFMPLAVLAYCNVHLVKALRESSRMRQLYRVHPNRATHGSRITPTLVSIVCMFLILVSPSEILHFYYYAIQGEDYEIFNMAIVTTNLLQTVNFGCNFVLYCLVNVHFRETWKDIVYCKACRREYYNRMQRRNTDYTLPSRSTKSAETSLDNHKA